MSPLEIANVLVSLAEHIAWPIATIVVIFSLREQIQQLLPSIRKLKAGPVELELEKVVAALEQTTKVASAADAKADLAVENLVKQSQVSDVVADESIELIERSPADATVASQVYVTPREKEALQALCKKEFVARTITGVAQDLQVTVATARFFLRSLEGKGLAARAQTSDRQVLWVATPTGRAVASEASQETPSK
jgi:hypothetical protein